jgi:alpha-ketoglutaric semialdehyde dehydrogenase
VPETLGRNLVGGVWQGAISGESFDDRNPADDTDLLATFPRSGPADIAEAVRCAEQARREWARVTVPRRADIILRVALELEQRKEELSRLMTREMGKTLRETRADVQEGIDFALYMAGEGRRFFGQTMPSELPAKLSLTLRAPVGTVGCITPWNFPIAIPMWKLAPALLCGNSVVFKPAEDTPLLAQLLVEVFERHGVPPGALNLVHGIGEEAGAALVDHPGVRAVSFTGSLAVGREIAERCGRAMKRASLELGGKNALIVMPDAEPDVAVEAAAWGSFATSGQRCTSTSRLIVHKEVRARFIEMMLKRVGGMKVGSGLDETVELAPVINRAQKERILEYIRIGQEEGARLLAGGREATVPGLEHGQFIEPTVFGDVHPEMRIAQEEIFGPVTAVMEVASLDQALEVCNAVGYGLSAAIYTRDISSVFRAIDEIEAGVIYVNAPTIGAEVQLPFGGVKGTGNGHREAGPQALDEFTEWKAVSIDYSGTLQRAQMD